MPEGRRMTMTIVNYTAAAHNEREREAPREAEWHMMQYRERGLCRVRDSSGEGAREHLLQSIK